MAKKRARPLSERVAERVHGNCSPAYLWLRVNYARLRKRMAFRYPPWGEVAAEMRDLGVMGGGRGGVRVPVTGDAVRRMWSRVCQDVATDGARRPPRPRYPPADWKPVAFAPRQVKVPVPGKAAPGREDPIDDVDARIAALRREADERSGR